MSISKREFNVIAAVAMNGVIGNSVSNTIPWHLPADLKEFKEITSHKTVVMGSNTLVSIGKALPNRKNVVITRDPSKIASYGIGEGSCYSNLSEVFESEEPDLFVIGGERIYRDALLVGPRHLYITVVNLEPEGDVYFPLPGHHFIEDVVYTGAGHRYECTHRTEWMTENGIEFMMTRFDRD